MTDTHKFVDGTIGGWESYKFHTRIQPGQIIEVNDYIDAVSVGINRRFFQYRTMPTTPLYKNSIVTGNEKVLSWLPYALVITSLGLVGTVVYAVLHWLAR